MIGIDPENHETIIVPFQVPTDIAPDFIRHAEEFGLEHGEVRAVFDDTPRPARFDVVRKEVSPAALYNEDLVTILGKFGDEDAVAVVFPWDVERFEERHGFEGPVSRRTFTDLVRAVSRRNVRAAYPEIDGAVMSRWRKQSYSGEKRGIRADKWADVARAVGRRAIPGSGPRTTELALRITVGLLDRR